MTLKLRASEANIWAAENGCRGYPLVVSGVEKKQNLWSKDGRLAHEIAAVVLCHYNETFKRCDAKSHPHALMCDQEMISSIDSYVDDVIAVACKTENWHYEIHVEERLHSRIIDDECIPDSWVDTGTDVYLWDFKYGHGIIEANDNWQLIIYALAIIDALSRTRTVEKHNKIHMRICQPRAYHQDGIIRECIMDVASLMNPRVLLQNAVAQARDKDAKTTAGPHCKHCPARHTCSSSIEAGLALYESSMQVQLLDMSVTAKASLLNVVQRGKAQLQNIEAALSEELKTRAICGDLIPGYSLQSGRGKVTWDVGVDEIAKISGDLIKNKEPITPTQARKLGFEIPENFVKKIPGELQLTKTE